MHMHTQVYTLAHEYTHIRTHLAQTFTHMLLSLLFFFQEKEPEKWPFIYFELSGLRQHSLPVPEKKRKSQTAKQRE